MALALFLILFLSFPASAGYQNLAIASGQSDFYHDTAKSQTFARFAANDPIYNSGTQTVNTTRAYNVVGIDGKTYQTTISRSAAADIPKVGSALSKFAQRVGPLAMAAATASLICDLTSICANAAEWVFNEVGFAAGSGNYSTCQEAIGLAAGANWQDCTTINAAHPNAFWFRSPSTPPQSANCTNRGGTSWTYTANAYTCNDPPVNPRPTTEADFTNAETPLSTPAGAERLAAELEPMPIYAPSPYQPLSLPIGKITTTNRDALGNATGTKTLERKLEIEDFSTLEEPNRAKVEERAIETTFDLNGDPVSSTETATETATQTEPQPEPEPTPSEDIEIDFDESQDNPLENFEVPSLFSYTSWGSGSCPQDTIENTKFGNITMSYEPICETAEGVRPFVILLALIGAFFIVTGSRK